MNKLLSSSLLLLLVALFSCKDNAPDAVLIRVKNTSLYDFDMVKVVTPEGSNSYGTVRSGTSSDYKVFDQAYRYAQIELLINGEEFRFQPIDYVGETPLENGRHTYEIGVVAIDAKRLSLTYKKE